jgi:hypothetical protein
MDHIQVDAVIKNPFSGRSISVKAIVNICTMLLYYAFSDSS